MSNTTIIILLLIAAALAVLLLRKRKPPVDDAAQPEVLLGEKPLAAVEKTTNLNKAAATEKAAAAPDDKAILEQLRAAGSDLSKPHNLDFYLYFPTEQAAYQAAEKLEAEGFEGELRRAPDPTKWMCMVRQEMVPELSKIAATKKRLTSLAKEFGGEYDGWETSLVS